jgi:RNA polymerase sigma factor (sigma-70 family)
VQHKLISSVICIVMNNSGKVIDLNYSLIAECRKNNRVAQIKLYGLFAKRMYNTSLRILKNRMLAEDAVQEAFISAFKTLDNFRGDVPFEAWLRRIVINRSIDEMRKENRTILEPLENKKNIVQEDFLSDDDIIEKENLISEVKKQLDELPNGYRIILSLFYLEGYDHEEISQILHITSSTSRSQLTRAIKKLREKMNRNKITNEFRQA